MIIGQRFEIDQFSNTHVIELENLEKIEGREIKVAGIITDATHLTSRKGSPYGRFMLEDYSGTFEFVAFKDDYVRWKNFFTQDWFVLVTAKVDSWLNKKNQQQVRRLKIVKMELLSDLREKQIKKVNLDIKIEKLTDELVETLLETCNKNKGSIPIQINVLDGTTRLEMPSRSIRVNLSRSTSEVLDSMEGISWSVQKV